MERLGTVGAGGRALYLLSPGEPSAPTVASNDACSVIFDGLILNRAELIQELDLKGRHDINPAGLALAAYWAWGTALLTRIKGAFAVVIWDRHRNLLLAARDPVGVHPLFYVEAGRQLFFSTSIDALIGQPGVPRTINRAALAESIFDRLLRADETLYSAVRRVPSGKLLRRGRAGSHFEPYWSPLPPGEPVDWLRHGEVEAFDGLLTQTTSRYLELGPAAIFLSGGLDSVSVAGVARDLCRQRGLPAPWALSLAFPDPESNEEPVQRSVAASLGLPQVMMPFDYAVGPEGLIHAALALSASAPAPSLNPWRPAYDRLALEAASHDCAVILTGSGGDEWLTVAPHYAADLMQSLNIVGLVRFWANSRSSYNLPLAPALRSFLWRYGGRPIVGALVGAALYGIAPSAIRARRQARLERQLPAWLAPDPALRRDLRLRAEQFVEEGFVRPELKDFYLQELRRSFDQPILSVEMEETFETGRRAGVQIVQPYWDPDLIELLCRVPPELLNKGGRSKALVRQALDRRFPDAGFGRQKKVLAVNFFQNLLKRDAVPAWRERGGAVALSRIGVVDAQNLNRSAEADLVGERYDRAFLMWQILNSEAWLRGHL